MRAEDRGPSGETPPPTLHEERLVGVAPRNGDLVAGGGRPLGVDHPHRRLEADVEPDGRQLEREVDVLVVAGTEGRIEPAEAEVDRPGNHEARGGRVRDLSREPVLGVVCVLSGAVGDDAAIGLDDRTCLLEDAVGPDEHRDRRSDRRIGFERREEIGRPARRHERVRVQEAHVTSSRVCYCEVVSCSEPEVAAGDDDRRAVQT
ncbi:MAG: hypothetical protein M5U31_15930 [Acidimicrobiia bacterium]|nr:hypothetical protein [Acidimicrobiia bacterium]